MDFYEELKARGLQYILRYVEYTIPHFSNFEKVSSFLRDIAFNPNKKCLVYGDYDLDGLEFIKITEGFLDALLCTNYEIFKYRKRTHELDREAVRYCIQNQFEYFIIGDTASSDMTTLKELTKYGIKVIVIDHHVCEFAYDDYPYDVAILNTTIENRLLSKDLYKYSAAAFAYVIYDAFAKENGIMFDKSYSAYALISLYSDCMDMSNELNRAIYYRAKSVERDDLPTFILHFMNEYQAFNARFIGYWYAPRINSLFRTEEFDLLNRYFFDKTLDAVQRSKCIQLIDKIYQKNREDTKLLVDLVDVMEFKHFVFADLGSASTRHNHYIKKPENYTGLVANKLSERFNKTAVVVSEVNGYFKGSLRDLYGRDYLHLFKHLCYAEGHNSAFGIKINLLELNSFLDRLERIDDRFSIESIPNEPMIVEHEYSVPDPVLIEDMAQYNEFSGNSIPVAYIQKRLVGAMKQESTSYYVKYNWDETYFVQSEFAIEFGTKMLIKPIKSGRTKLLYQG